MAFVELREMKMTLLMIDERREARKRSGVTT
jgi:hypothetical protein